MNYRNKIMQIIRISFVLMMVQFIFSCKNDWLEIKPNKKLEVPSSIQDAISLLDNFQQMNEFVYSPFGEVSSDNYLTIPDKFERFIDRDKNLYFWKSDIYDGKVQYADNWHSMYKIILNSNLALEVLSEIETNNQFQEDLLNQAKGRAYFFRGYTFYHLSILYGDVHIKEFQTNGLGIPLKLSSDINVVSFRSTIEETNIQIKKDLMYAAQYLDDKSSINTRPSKASSFAVLSRLALQLQNYEEALNYADSCLKISSFILDYNTIENTSYPFNSNNSEIIFYSSMSGNSLISESNSVVNPELYKIYNSDDLRKSLFFKNTNGAISFKGSYNGDLNTFNGITVPEIILIKAECLARLNKIQESRQAISVLLNNRYKNGFMPNIPNNKSELILFIFDERRKELIFRGIRWADLRRLNLESEYQVELKRNYNGNEYILSPNDPRYLLEIPPTVIYRSNVIQNFR